jgi:uncharacterized protein GlcG (DUF336 family)
MKRTLLSVALLCAALVAPRSSAAQLADAKVITLPAAKAMVAAAQAEARKNNWNVTVAVVDAAGELIALERMDGAALTTVAVATGKARTAARFRRETRLLDSAVTAGRIQTLAFEGVVPIEGGVPVLHNNVVIGAVGVSGATSVQDAQVAKAGIAVLKP